MLHVQNETDNDRTLWGIPVIGKDAGVDPRLWFVADDFKTVVNAYSYKKQLAFTLNLHNVSHNVRACGHAYWAPTRQCRT